MKKTKTLFYENELRREVCIALDRYMEKNITIQELNIVIEDCRTRLYKIYGK